MPYAEGLLNLKFKEDNEQCGLTVTVLFVSDCLQKLNELEAEEELREKAGEYDSDMSEEDEEMTEIRSMAKK